MSAETVRRWLPIAPGVNRTTLVSGATMMQMLVTLTVGSKVPVHQHPHEQISFVVSGRLRFLVADEAHDVKAGEAIYLAANVPHGVEALEESLVTDTFSPPREDLLSQDRA